MWDFDELSKKYTPYQVDKLRNHVPNMQRCMHCGDEFDAQTYLFRPTSIYPITKETCSRSCTSRYGGTKNKRIFKDYKCLGCNAAFVPHPKKPHQQYCSVKCRGLAIKGKRRPEVHEWIHKIKPPRNSISRSGTVWLDQNNVSLREHWIEINGEKFRVDGFDPATNTVYEYYGSFWHGNPDVYDSAEINPVNKQSFGSLYEKTQNRLRILEQAGYRVIYTWSSR